MLNRHRPAMLVALLATSAIAPAAHAGTYVFNTDNGLITLDGNPVSTVNGVTVGVVTNPTTGASFKVQGDLDLYSGNLGANGTTDVLTATGSVPLRIDVGNNVFVMSGARIDVAASGINAGPGGGGSALGGAGGVGGKAANYFGLNPPAGGAGGAGEHLAIFCDGNRGCYSENPSAAASGLSGGTPDVVLPGGGGGYAGATGGQGYGNRGVTDAIGGHGGTPAVGVLHDNLGGAGGAPGVAYTSPAVLSGGDGRPGGPGAAGGAGLAGSDGGAGATGGAGANVPASLTSLTGGNAGGGGGGGAGGNPGTDGGGGGGGGGGSGGQAGENGYSGAANGVQGGRGGDGGAGGNGGAGGRGGSGGAGGGAVQITARGRVILGGDASAKGGAGFAGSAGAAGGDGASGSPGAIGQLGAEGFNDASITGGAGGKGGDGGAGGAGGSGGSGGIGGAGGGGAGGTVKVLATAADVIGTVDVSGGGGAAQGGAGRFVLGVSSSSSNFTPVGFVDAQSEAPKMANPYAGVLTPLIAPGPGAGSQRSMLGGASAYGVLDQMAYFTPNLQADVLNAPIGANAFLALLPNGISGYDNVFNGYEMLILVNLSASNLIGGRLMGQALQTYGFADDPSWGGSGTPQALAALGPDQIFATLVPTSTTDGSFSFNDGTGTFAGILNNSGVIYDTAAYAVPSTDVPEPTSLALLAAGLSSLATARRRRKPSSDHHEFGYFIQTHENDHQNRILECDDVSIRHHHTLTNR